MKKVLALCAITLLALVSTGAAQAKDWWSVGGNPSVTFLQVTEKLRTRYIQFDGEYDIDSESCFNRWLAEDRATPIGCEAWVDQKPRQLTLYVRYQGRVIFSDEINGYLVDYAKPYKGATFSTRLYTSDLGSRCHPGTYYWQLVLGDPLQRHGGGASVKHSFALTCNR